MIPIVRLMEQIHSCQKVGMTVIAGGLAGGKSTLKTAIEKALLHVEGFVAADMSDIMKWHRRPENHSPLMEKFVEAKGVMGSKDLVSDHLTLDGFFYYLAQKQKQFTDEQLRHIVVSGVPRKITQLRPLQVAFPKMRMAYIDVSFETADEMRLKRIADGEGRSEDDPDIFNGRWETFREFTLPMVTEFKKHHEENQFKRIRFTLTPTERALRLLSLMDIKGEEAGSIRNQLTRPGRAAYEYLMGVGKPKSLLAPQNMMIPGPGVYRESKASVGARVSEL